MVDLTNFGSQKRAGGRLNDWRRQIATAAAKSQAIIGRAGARTASVLGVASMRLPAPVTWQ